MSQSTVLLDLDGTLLDSANGITEHLSAAIASVGAVVPLPETLRACVGPPFEVVMPTLGLRPDQVQAAITEYRRTYDPVAAALSVPYPGITALLDRLVDRGIALAVATAKPESLARDIVTDNGLAGYFEVIGGTDRAIGRTEKAAVIRSVLERLALSNLALSNLALSNLALSNLALSNLAQSNPAEMVMVGDRLHDVHGAAALGLDTIGVSWGYAEPGELLDAGAIAVVDTPRELGDLLLQRFRRAA